MSVLRETEAAFAELAATKQHEFGVRHGLQARVGHRGIDIGEQLFDPARHNPTDINTLSLMGMVTDQPHVKVVLPDLPMEVSIVTHNQTGKDSPEMALSKQRLGQALRHSLESAVPRIGDRIYSYHIGDTSDAGVNNSSEFIEADENPSKNIKKVEDICFNGLTFVISTFGRGLPLGIYGTRYENIIGIKANTALELRLPNDVNVRLGGSREASTPAERAEMNARLDQHHQGIENRLLLAGIKLAKVVFDGNHPSGLQFEPREADVSIAKAVRSLEH